LKGEKALEIVYLLELFDGKLSLTEILNLEIPLLATLRRAKEKINKDVQNRQRK